MPEYTTGEAVSEGEYSNLPKATREYLAYGAAKGERDNRLFAAACQFRDAGYSQEEAEAALVPRAVTDGFTEEYSRRKIGSAYKKAPRDPAAGSHHASSAAPPPSGHSSNSSSSSASAPLPLPSPIPDGFKVLLNIVFLPGEGVVIGRGRYNGNGDLQINGGTLNKRESWLARLAAKTISELYPKACDGLFLRINPMKGRGKSDADVESFRHLLVEFDMDSATLHPPKELQYAWLIDSKLPISAIVNSANRSIQAAVRLDAPDRKEYDRRGKLVIEYFCGYAGFDAQTFNPSRYFRCPEAVRNLYDDQHRLIGTARQELLEVKVGAASWEKWEKSRGTNPGIATAEEAAAHDAEVVTSLLKEDESLPEPMGEAAFYGIAGEIVKIIETDNEPCRESLLGHFLIGFGNMLGWNPWMYQGDHQHTNEFGLFVGPSGLGRKGTAWSLVRRLLLEVDHEWAAKRVRRALQSGEAIIHEIRDACTRGSGKHQQYDPGVDDKRMVILESEATRFLTVGKRRGNNLFDVTHDCWDSLDPLCCTSKTAGESATHPHVSMIAHSTVAAYLAALPEEEKTNGSVNRCLIMAVYRAKKRSRPPLIRWRTQHWPIIQRLQKVLSTFSVQREMNWSKEAISAWDAFYHDFETKTKGGMISSILDRMPTHVVRIAMIYCALDNCCLISVDHLAAAMAFCAYARRSAEWLFGVKTGNHDADKLYAYLARIRPERKNRTEIIEYVFRNRVAGAQLDEIFRLLLKAELIGVKSEPNPRKGPRFIEKWYAI